RAFAGTPASTVVSRSLAGGLSSTMVLPLVSMPSSLRSVGTAMVVMAAFRKRSPAMEHTPASLPGGKHAAGRGCGVGGGGRQQAGVGCAERHEDRGRPAPRSSVGDDQPQVPRVDGAVGSVGEVAGKRGVVDAV